MENLTFSPMAWNSAKVHGIFVFVTHLRKELGGFFSPLYPMKPFAVLGNFQSWKLKLGAEEEEEE